ncbi:MAG: hypothetical protein V1800_17000 [Candidatus Latescibacterota bacterium]
MKKKIPRGTRVLVKLTLRERDLIRDDAYCDPDFGRLAISEGRSIRIYMTLDEIEDIQGYVAAEANHTENRKLQKELDKFSDKLQVFLDTYDDEEY